MEEILAFLSGIFPLSPKCIEYLGTVVRFRRVSRNETILAVGEVNHKLYFIKTGLLPCYYFVNNKPISDWFFWEKETVVSIGSFYDQVPSEDCIVALEDCEIFFITKEQYDYVCRRFLLSNVCGNVRLEKEPGGVHGLVG